MISFSPRLACNLVYAHLTMGRGRDGRAEVDAELARDPELETRLRSYGIGVN